MALSRPTQTLAQSPLFQQDTQFMPTHERICLSYQRAEAIICAYGLTRKDILMLTPKFWALHTDPIWNMDGAAGTLCTVQLNLCVGTLLTFAKGRKDIDLLVDDLLRFSVSGQFCLTEVGHGLDIINMETTATLIEDGRFDLHTPHEYAAKYMPPTTPIDRPCVAIVFARTIVNSQDHGVKPFLVSLNDGGTMSTGVTSRLLPPRGGSRPLNHALTSFNHVVLPPSALLGSLNKPTDARASFFDLIQRVMVGTIAIGSLSVCVLQVSATIAARYSLRRKVQDHQSGVLQPIISFQTQKTPVLTALSHAFIMQAYQRWAAEAFMSALDPRIQHAIATILKVVMIDLAQASNLTLGDRCGAQGLFEVNQLTAMHLDMRGAAIAEGDTLVISIRLASELLLKRYIIPPTSDPSGLLAQHEAGLFEELRGILSKLDHHRSDAFNEQIMPECVGLVKAIGHRMAYDAAVASDVDPALVDLFVASIVKQDSAWYVEKAGISRAQQRQMEAAALAVVFPRLEEFLAQMDVEAYISAPMVSDKAWDDYVQMLPEFAAVAI